MSDKLPTVSIVTPAYNYAGYLEETIESVLNQDYPNIEYLVLDDGSTDDTRQVLDKYTGRIRWESHANMGEAKTLNKGWGMLGGEILGKLSADDVLLPNAVSASVERLLANPDAVLTYGNYGMFDSDSVRFRTVNAPEVAYEDMVAGMINPAGPGALFRRDVYGAAGPWNDSLRLTLDYEFWLRIGLQGRFLKVPEVVGLLRIHDSSQSLSRTEEYKSEEYVRVMRDYYELPNLPPEVLAVRRKALGNAYILTARSHIRSRRYGIGLKRLSEGFYIYPRNLPGSVSKKFVRGFLNYVGYRRRARGKGPGGKGYKAKG